MSATAALGDSGAVEVADIFGVSPLQTGQVVLVRGFNRDGRFSIRRLIARRLGRRRALAGPSQPSRCLDTGERATPGRRSEGFVAWAAAAAIALGACGGGSRPAHVADLGTAPSSAGGRSRGASSSTTLPTGNPAQLLDDWASCMRTHGDPNQVDPTIDADKVIEITQPAGYSNGLHGLIAGNSCAVYLTTASTALNGGTPLKTPDLAQELKFAECMRAHGIPDYPDPTAGNGAIQAAAPGDLDPNNPMLQSASRVCDKEDPGVSKFSDTPEPGSIDANIVGQPKGAPGGNGGSGANG